MTTIQPRNLARTLQERGLPPEPPTENPHEVASAQWTQLREYATRLAEITAEVDDDNKALRAENESLRREVERLTKINTEVGRENRTMTAYAQALRTRLTAIREGIEAAEREALSYAGQDVREKTPPTPEEQREVEQVISSIANMKFDPPPLSLTERVAATARTSPPSVSWNANRMGAL